MKLEKRLNKCSNEIITGMHGYGKTEEIKKEMKDILKTNDKIIIVHYKDKNEYQDVLENQDAFTYDLSKDTLPIFNLENITNDFDCNFTVEFAYYFLITILDFKDITSHVKCIIEKSLIEMFNNEKYPTVSLFLSYLGKYLDTKTYIFIEEKLKKCIELEYINKSLTFSELLGKGYSIKEANDYFKNTKTYKDSDAQIIEFIIDKEQSTLKANIILMRILDAMFKNWKTSRTWVFFDDASLYFQNNEIGLLEHLYKMSRKYRMNVCSVFYTLYEISNTQTGRLLINNSYYTIFKQQNLTELSFLKERFELFDIEIEILKNAKPGEHLEYAEEKIFY